MWTSIMLLPFIFFFMASAEIVTTSNISTDQAALLVLKSHIQEPHNILETNWSTASSFCGWIGITCDSRSHRVTALDFSYMHLTGTIPPQLGNLSFLTQLSFQNNSFHGSLPEELTRLRKLKFISFGGNSLNGYIPSWFGRFAELEILKMDGNQFSGSIPTSFFNLSSLRILDLSANKLSGTPSLYVHVSAKLEGFEY